MAGQPLQVDPVATTAEGQLETVVHETLAHHPRADPSAVDEIDGPPLQEPGANPRLDVVTRLPLDDDRVDAAAQQELREQEARRARSDDGDLRARHANLRPGP